MRIGTSMEKRPCCSIVDVSMLMDEGNDGVQLDGGSRRARLSSSRERRGRMTDSAARDGKRTGGPGASTQGPVRGRMGLAEAAAIRRRG